MDDEKEGPYKVVQTLARGGWDRLYKIAIEKKSGSTTFFQEYIPDAGNAESSRHICNLLNKEWRMQQMRVQMEGIQNDAVDRLDGEGLQRPDLGDGSA